MKMRICLAAATVLTLAAAIAASAAQINHFYHDRTVDGQSFTGGYLATQPYKVGAIDWVVNLDPPQPEYLSGLDASQTDLLRSGYSMAAGWDFVPSEFGLGEDTLRIINYTAVKDGGGVGANFVVEYNPNNKADPVNNIHWIQLVTTNHPKGGQHGDAKTSIDNRFLTTPYYDHGGTAGPHYFSDSPRRTDIGKVHNWTAYLFLVSGPNLNTTTDPVSVVPGPVTVYGGVKWGWENHCVAATPRQSAASDVCTECLCAEQIPESSTFGLLASGLAFVFFIRQMRHCLP